MTTIGVRDLRQNASKYLARVEAGEELDVTNNGRLVARLVPVPEAARSRQTLVDAGILIPASRPSAATRRRPRPLPTHSRTLSGTLSEMRDEA